MYDKGNYFFGRLHHIQKNSTFAKILITDLRNGAGPDGRNRQRPGVKPEVKLNI